MSVLSIDNEVAALNVAYGAAKKRNEGLGYGPQPALDAAYAAAIAAADANPAGSTAVLAAAQAKFQAFAVADRLIHAKARSNGNWDVTA